MARGKDIDRRQILRLYASGAAAFLAQQGLAFGAEQVNAPQLGDFAPFSADSVVEAARLLSKAPYDPPADTVPEAYKALSYDQYRALRFRKDAALWKDDDLPFRIEFFSTGYIYRAPVAMYVVDGNRAAPVLYSSDLFTYGPGASPPPAGSAPGFSGFRIHAPIN